ncbi:MAG: sigma 54-interacting transcriptional regulator, partial [Thermoanaerobacteraceae bacterium]|nr:sigma 54-interacting transcriptional regulator [Thermoanaerobacteraceae bacterium]
MAQSSEQMLSLWKQMRLADYPEGQVREEIRASWARSMEYGVSPYLKMNRQILPPEKLALKIEENRELVEVALPIIKNLFEFVKGSGFVVALADREGTLLVVVGDEEGIEFTRKANFIEGTRWSEDLMGTNAVGLSLVEGKPVQVYGYEHFCICAYNSTCSAAPIRDAEGRIIGVLDITGPFEKVHHHTLGMVVAGVSAIENQMALKKALRENLLASQYKTHIMESISDGIMTTDNFGYITHLNRPAARLLHLDREKVIGQNLAQVLGDEESNYYFINLVRSKKIITDTVVNLTRNHETVRCAVSCSPLIDQDGQDMGRVVVLQEIKRVNRLINKLVGPRARVHFSELIGKEDCFIEALRVGRAAAASDCNVLLLGESGTGKDLFAQAIHNASVRAEQPFVAINCAAIPRDLIASELFGYDEGAFTGAKKGGNPGKFELADQGTIFLDEIGEMPVDLQAALLRVLEERRVMRVGGREYIPVNVRVIAATNKDLALEVEKGNFRRDLFYRLSVMVIQLPPLRERKADIRELATYFLKRISGRLGKGVEGFAPETLDLFLNYHWPGNIRELQNVVERAVNLATGPVITTDLLPPGLTESVTSRMISPAKK